MTVIFFTLPILNRKINLFVKASEEVKCYSLTVFQNGVSILLKPSACYVLIESQYSNPDGLPKMVGYI